MAQQFRSAVIYAAKFFMPLQGLSSSLVIYEAKSRWEHQHDG